MKKLPAVVVIIVLLAVYSPSQTAPVTQRQEPPASFVGDGCTLWPDCDYRSCCEAHDRDYYRGGTGAERKASDKRLRDCVRAKGHNMLLRLCTSVYG